MPIQSRSLQAEKAANWDWSFSFVLSNLFSNHSCKPSCHKSQSYSNYKDSADEIPDRQVSHCSLRRLYSKKNLLAVKQKMDFLAHQNWFVLIRLSKQSAPCPRHSEKGFNFFACLNWEMSIMESIGDWNESDRNSFYWMCIQSGNCTSSDISAYKESVNVIFKVRTVAVFMIAVCDFFKKYKADFR